MKHQSIECAWVELFKMTEEGFLWFLVLTFMRLGFPWRRKFLYWVTKSLSWGTGWHKVVWLIGYLTRTVKETTISWSPKLVLQRSRWTICERKHQSLNVNSGRILWPGWPWLRHRLSTVTVLLQRQCACWNIQNIYSGTGRARELHIVSSWVSLLSTRRYIRILGYGRLRKPIVMEPRNSAPLMLPEFHLSCSQQP
jgi:hypothetical protein